MLNPEQIKVGTKVLVATKADTGLPTLMEGVIDGYAVWEEYRSGVKTVNVPLEYPAPTPGGFTTGTVFVKVDQGDVVAIDIAEVYVYDGDWAYHLTGLLDNLNKAYSDFTYRVNDLRRR